MGQDVRGRGVRWGWPPTSSHATTSTERNRQHRPKLAMAPGNDHPYPLSHFALARACALSARPLPQTL
eukprot:5416920-Alexandrium_andersonii.AAC.1